MIESLISIIKSKTSDVQYLEMFMSICLNAHRQAIKAEDAIDLQIRISEALGDDFPFKCEDDYQSAKSRAAKIAKFAVREKECGYSYLHGISTIRLWTILESLADDICRDFLSDADFRKSIGILSKIKVPVSEIISAKDEELTELLTELIKDTIAAPLKCGIGRFEAIFDQVSMGGCVDENVKKILYELSQVRNAIVHRNGIADKSIILNCPWLKLNQGDSITITDVMMGNYFKCCYWYILEIRKRVGSKFSGNNGENISTIQNELISMIKLA